MAKISTTEEKVIRAAELLFAKKGYHGTSIRDIAEHENLNVSVINYYFTSKENLLLHILSKIKVMTKEILDKINLDQNEKEKLRSFIELTSDYIILHERLIKILMQEALFNVSNSSRKIFMEIVQLHKQVFINIILKGKSNGQFLYEEKPEHLYHFAMGTINNILTFSIIEKTKDNHLQYKINEITLQLLKWLNVASSEVDE